MQLIEENPKARFVVRAVGPDAVLVNDRTCRASLIVAPDRLIEDWRHAPELTPEDLAPILALAPDVILLGTGDRLRRPSMAVFGHCLSRGVGIEVMDNAAAGRTYNVLVGEQRAVVAAFMLPVHAIA